MCDSHPLRHGALMPPEAFLNDDLAIKEKVIFGLIFAFIHENEYEYCDVTNKQFGNLISIHPNSVSKAVSNLKKQQYIKVVFEHKENEKGFKRKIFINEDFRKVYAPMLKEKYERLDDATKEKIDISLKDGE